MSANWPRLDRAARFVYAQQLRRIGGHRQQNCARRNAGFHKRINLRDRPGASRFIRSPENQITTESECHTYFVSSFQAVDAAIVNCFASSTGIS